MPRIHIALATHDMQATIEDYSARLGMRPCALVPGEYALWRNASLNLSVRKDHQCRPGQLRHLGFEDPDARTFALSQDVNGIAWEQFTAQQQAAEIEQAFPGTGYVPAEPGGPRPVGNGMPILKSACATLPVSQLAPSIRYFESMLGFRLAWTWGDPPQLACVCRDQVEINLALRDPSAPRQVVKIYVRVADVDHYYCQATQAGARVANALADRAYGMRDCRLLDPDDHELSFGESIDT